MDGPVPSTSPFDLEAVYLRHHRLVRWIVRAAGIPEAAVDDVSHDVFVAIHRRRDAFTHGDLRKWIIGVTRSVCHAHRRAHARAQRRLARLPAPAPPPTPEDLTSHRHELRRLQRALDELDPAQREAFVHIELGGLTAPEAAAVLGAKVATVTSRLRLARRRVGAALGLDARVLAREAGQGDTADTRRAWGVIAARIAVEPVVPAATAIGGGGWLAGGAVGAALGAALMGVFVMTRPPDATRPPPPRVAPADPPAIVDAPRSPTVAIEHDPPPVDVREVAPAAPAVRARPRRPIPTPTVAPHVDPTPAPTVDPSAPTDALAAEAKLLRRAAQEIDAGQRDLAVRTLQDHARRFPAGQLADERERLRALLGPPRGGPPLVSAG